jgi:signal transduction histidine kinase
MAHFITITKILTSITATIRKNPTPPEGMQIGVVIWFVLTFESMKIIEPDYVKASKFFWIYWGIYLASLCIYYKTILTEQIFTYCCLFWLVHEIYKENYLLSNSLTEIFYDFHNDPIVFYEGGTNIKVNRSFLTHFGYLVKTSERKHHSQMLTEIANPEKIMFGLKLNWADEKISLLHVLQNKKKMEQTELSLAKKDVEKVFLFTHYKLENIYDDKTVWIFKNITHVHQLQKVKSQVEFRSIIMGCLTHELRTPINCVISILKSLEDFIENSEEARKLLMVCQGTIEMLRSLTEDFIDFTRFENEKGLPIKKEWINLNDFFNEINNIFSFQAQEKDLRFDINRSYEVPETIYTDPKRLKQVILNLLSNSFKFTQRGKIEINLSVKKALKWKFADHFTIEDDYKASKSLVRGSNIEDKKLKNNKLVGINLNADLTSNDDMRSYLFVEVIDTGLGISEKDKKELFTKFGTGKKSRGLNTNGLGLGLYLSKEIWLKLNGDLTWESMEGIGSTFIIMLPFDAVYEMKELLAKKTSKVLHKMEEFSPVSKDDFKEFRNADTKDSMFDVLNKNYSLKCAKSCFKVNSSISIMRKWSESEYSNFKSEESKNIEEYRPIK